MVPLAKTAASYDDVLSAQGVLALAWCPQDVGFLLSTGKDGRTLCWDAESGDLLSEGPVSDQWNFDIQVRLQGWVARIPGGVVIDDPWSDAPAHKLAQSGLNGAKTMQI